jgi:hypothetical protein
MQQQHSKHETRRGAAAAKEDMRAGAGACTAEGTRAVLEGGLDCEARVLLTCVMRTHCVCHAAAQVVRGTRVCGCVLHAVTCVMQACVWVCHALNTCVRVCCMLSRVCCLSLTCVSSHCFTSSGMISFALT